MCVESRNTQLESESSEANFINFLKLRLSCSCHSFTCCLNSSGVNLLRSSNPSHSSFNFASSSLVSL